MKPILKFIAGFSLVTILTVSLSSFLGDAGSNDSKPRFSFPYKKAGLTERQAAAHLLSRFTYGAKPGQVDEVVEMGLEKWFQQQLDANIADDTLNSLLKEYDAINLSNAEVIKQFPRNPHVYKMAVADGFINKDSVSKADKKEYKDKVDEYKKLKGYKDEKELFRQFINQKILRAANGNNQLQEVLTDFWFNHFNVSITKNDCAQFIPAYERDVIRPNVLGNFQTLLMATTKSPAMLLYLDNFTSAGTNDGFDMPGANAQKRRLAYLMTDTSAKGKAALQKMMQSKKNNPGLNENYAREIMELHTMGVDGGYTQSDVTQAARVLTGWTIYPFTDYGPAGNMKKAVERFGEDKLTEKGFIHEGDFLFAVNRHDDREKVVLGKKFEAGGGYEEGVELLKMLSAHASTAKFISKKLAVRFVNDNPSPVLVDKMAKSFIEKKGDLKQVLITLATSPEFWAKEALREKTKSPFELAISSVRSLDATVRFPFQLNNWITKMGQKIYFYQAPTGYPDKGQYWINTGSLLNRMNFGLALATQKIPGITFNLAALNHNKEPESAEAALNVYSKILMPERNVDETIKRLTPLLNDPNLQTKVSSAANKTAAPAQETTTVQNDEMMGGEMAMKDKEPKEKFSKKDKGNSIMNMQTYAGNNTMLSQVVGIIIGSPEYQRK
jgi:uncharacterized protein (DUF1800 family)